MRFLHSNFLPVDNTGCATFYDEFYNQIKNVKRLDIAVGYITADSLVDLEQTIRQNDIKNANLVIGVHYHQHFTRKEYSAACHLNDYLESTKKGHVYVVQSFKYHGKLYTYSDNDGPYSCIIGSNNLSSISKSYNRLYESSVILDDKNLAVQLHSFILLLINKASKVISGIGAISFRNSNPVLTDYTGAEKVSFEEKERIKSTIQATRCLKLPIKTCPKSNINAYFGKGRKATNGVVKPRPWYEVELIVPSTVIGDRLYPGQNGRPKEFTVITDDGWKFKCGVNGDNNKNFRSKDDLTILGRWIKGRLEENEVLRVGEEVTDGVLDRYGRSDITLYPTNKKDIYYLDFGVGSDVIS